jgi:hypothetical protein
MKEPHTEGIANHSDPDVMWVRPQGRTRSVGRGMCRPVIEPRKTENPRGRCCPDRQKAIPTIPLWRGVAVLAWSREPVHAQNHSAREPGDPGVALGRMLPSGRGGKSKDVIRR